RTETAGEHAPHEGFVYVLVACSFTVLPALGLLYRVQNSLSVDATLCLCGGCVAAFAAGIAFALMAHSVSTTRRARIVAISVTALNAVLFLAAGLIFVLLVELSQMEFELG